MHIGTFCNDVVEKMTGKLLITQLKKSHIPYVEWNTKRESLLLNGRNISYKSSVCALQDEDGASYKGNRRLLEYNLLWTHYQPYLDHNASHAGVRRDAIPLVVLID